MEPEYIERKALDKALTSAAANDKDKNRRTWAKAICVLHDLPAADVAPVVHSYWEGYSCSRCMGTDEYGEPKWRDGRFYVCHNYKCRRKTVVKSSYCPNCGARMDGDSDALD